MGAIERAKEKARDAQRAAKNERRVATNGTPGTAADWTAVNAEWLRAAVAQIAAEGGAIRLGYTRDLGAYSIGIYGDGEPYTDYLRPSEDVDAYLERLFYAWGGS